jgi:DNA polymerase-1
LRIALDSEYNHLDNPTLIHCICCVDIDTDKEYTFRGDYADFLVFVKNATVVIGHNIIDADWRWISSLIDNKCIPADRVIDTLILSKLHHYRQDGGHSLENWGELLDHPKLHTDITDWSRWTPQIEERCMNDAWLTARLFKTLEPMYSRNYTQAIEAEHKLGFICLDMHRNGFRFDADAAQRLHTELSTRVADLDRELLSAFLPKSRDGGTYVPKLTKKGTISRTNLRWWEGNDC